MSIMEALRTATTVVILGVAALFDFKRVIDGNDTASRRGFTMVWATLALTAATIILAIAALTGLDVEVELLATSGSLAGMAGYSYGVGKKVEGRPDAG
jgi:hypothetical protein